MVTRYTSIFYILLFIIFIYRFWQVCLIHVNNINYLEYQGRVYALVNKKFSQEFRTGYLYVKTNNIFNLEDGDLVELKGKISDIKVNPLYRQWWYVNPSIKVSKFEDLSLSKQIIHHPLIFLSKQTKILKETWSSQLDKLLTNSESALLKGIIFGSKDNMPFQLYQRLKQSGLMHIAVASGSNIVILSNIVFLLLISLGRKLTHIVAILLIVLYATLTGLEPPIVRASIMMLLIFLLSLRGIKTNKVIVLLNTILIMIVINPELVFSVSFQLSVSATLGILMYGVWTNNVLLSLIRKYPRINWLRFIIPDLSQTVCAQVYVLPLLIYYFNQITLWLFISNVLVLSIIAYVIIGGILILACSYVFFPLSQALAWLLSILLEYILWIINLFGASERGIVHIKLNVISLIILWVILAVGFNRLVKPFQDSDYDV